MKWLSANLPAKFWDLFKCHLDDLNIKHREELVAINGSMRLKPGKSLLKHMSYNGAIELPDGVPECVLKDMLIWELDESPVEGKKKTWMDPGNSLYATVFKKIWPAALPDITNDETCGDVLEAFLGYHWTLTYERNVEFPPIIEDIVSMVTKALLGYWALETYYPEWR